MELLAKRKGECDGLFLKLDDTQHEIQGEEGTEEYSAFWDPTAGGGGGGSPTDPASPSPPIPPPPPGCQTYGYLCEYASGGRIYLYRHERVTPEAPTWVQDTSGRLGLRFRLADYGQIDAFTGSDPPQLIARIYRYQITNTTEYVHIYTLNGNQVGTGQGPIRAIYSCLTPPAERLGPPTNPPPPDDGGGDGGNPVGAVVIQSVKGGISKQIQTIAHPSKPSTASFLCEDCEPNCILLTRKQGDKYASGLCICKDNQEVEDMKDKIKAELLTELPPIVQTRIKAQDVGPLKKEIKDELKEELPPLIVKVLKEEVPETLDSDVYIQKHVGVDTVDKDGKPVIAPPKPLTTVASNIKDALLKNPEFLEAPSLIKAIETVIQEQVPEVKDSIEYSKHVGILDDKGKEIKIPDPDNPEGPPIPAIPTITNVVSNVKDILVKDSEFLNALWSDIESRLLTQEFKISLFTGDEIATLLADSLNDESKLAALKAKLGIAAPQADANKLTANGYEWTITKDTAGAVVSVSRVAKAGDNLSLLTNSSSAIVTALVAKFPGKSFAVTSSTQNAGTYFYSIDQN